MASAAVGGLSAEHWLMVSAEREVSGCHCGFRADSESDCGYGDSVVRHLFEVAAQAALTEAAAAIDEFATERASPT